MKTASICMLDLDAFKIVVVVVVKRAACSGQTSLSHPDKQSMVFKVPAGFAVRTFVHE
jgi:hypothetical protein